MFRSLARSVAAAARPCAVAARGVVSFAPLRVLAPAARPLAARVAPAAPQWSGFRSSALAASDGEAPARQQEDRANQARHAGASACGPPARG
jgi:hypothetical protein